jgi:hypothetical protein
MDSVGSFFHAFQSKRLENLTSVFDTFQSKCLENLTDESAKSYCQPMQEALESSWEFVRTTPEWTGKAAMSVGSTWMWYWTKSGEYVGPNLQMVFLALTVVITYNVKNMVFGKSRDVVVISKPAQHPAERS